MQQLTVPYLHNGPPTAPLQQLLEQLNGLPQQAIAQEPWPQYPSGVAAAFRMAYTNDGLVLQYVVTEPAIRAVNTEVNAPVYEDSCVELFLAFDATGYYNLEFNCIGTPLAAFGTGKKDRQFLEPLVVAEIETEARIERTGTNDFSWKLGMKIPFILFVHHPQLQWKGLQCKANFFKCGDGLPQPHFLSWAPIAAPAPDFHLPQFFGTLHFEA